MKGDLNAQLHCLLFIVAVECDWLLTQVSGRLSAHAKTDSPPPPPPPPVRFCVTALDDVTGR